MTRHKKDSDDDEYVEHYDDPLDGCPRCSRRGMPTPLDSTKIRFIDDSTRQMPIRWFRPLGGELELQQIRHMYCSECMNRFRGWIALPIVDRSKDVADKLRSNPDDRQCL